MTDPGDVVLDIFAGSNTTGQIAQNLGRKWLAFEYRSEYLETSRFRFRSWETIQEEASERDGEQQQLSKKSNVPVETQPETSTD